MMKIHENKEAVKNACNEYATKRDSLLNKLSLMHYRYCEKIGKHPVGLILTEEDAKTMGWGNGYPTPFYCNVISVAGVETKLY